jgi:hypothetical protein
MSEEPLDFGDLRGELIALRAHIPKLRMKLLNHTSGNHGEKLMARSSWTGKQMDKYWMNSLRSGL